MEWFFLLWLRLFQHKCPVLFEFIVEVGSVAAHGNQLLKVQLLLIVDLDVVLVDELLYFPLAHFNELLSLRQLLESHRLALFALILISLQIFDVALQVHEIVVKLFRVCLQLVIEAPHVLVRVFFQILVNLVDVLSVPDTCYPLCDLLTSQRL